MPNYLNLGNSKGLKSFKVKVQADDKRKVVFWRMIYPGNAHMSLPFGERKWNSPPHLEKLGPEMQRVTKPGGGKRPAFRETSPQLKHRLASQRHKARTLLIMTAFWSQLPGPHLTSQAPAGSLAAGGGGNLSVDISWTEFYEKAGGTNIYSMWHCLPTLHIIWLTLTCSGFSLGNRKRSLEHEFLCLVKKWTPLLFIFVVV